MQKISISISFVKMILEHAAKLGYDPQKLLLRARISPQLLAQPQSRVSADQYANLQAVTMREMEDELMGYSSLPLKIGQWSALCHWVIQCKNLAQVLKRYCLFYDMMGKAMQLRKVVNGTLVIIEFSPWPEEQSGSEPYLYELFMFSMHRLMCWLTASNLHLEKAAFSYAKPEYASEYRAMFLGAPVEFDAPVSALVFRREFLEWPVKQTPQTLADFLRHPLYNILTNTYKSKSWTGRVKEVIGEDLSHLPSFAEIANALDTNPKQLRRRLNDEGLSYRALKLQLRRDVAIDHLSRRETSVEEIAFLAGFSEASAFIRAFKTWTGVTPHTYRKDLAP